MSITYPIIKTIKVIYFIWVCLTYFCLGAHYAIFPVLTIRTFGLEEGSNVYALVTFSMVVAAFLGFGLNILASKMIGGFDTIFWVFFCFTVVASALALVFKETKNK